MLKHVQGPYHLGACVSRSDSHLCHIWPRLGEAER